MKLNLGAEHLVSRLAHDAATAHVLARKLVELRAQVAELVADTRPEEINANG